MFKFFSVFVLALMKVCLLAGINLLSETAEVREYISANLHEGWRMGDRRKPPPFACQRMQTLIMYV